MSDIPESGRSGGLTSWGRMSTSVEHAAGQLELGGVCRRTADSSDTGGRLVSNLNSGRPPITARFPDGRIGGPGPVGFHRDPMGLAELTH